jgi:hypothetical protein
MKKLTAAIALFLLGSSFLPADTFTLSFNQNVTDNLFQNRLSEKDQLSALSFYADKNLSRLSLYAEGSYSYLFQNPNLATYIQDAGIDYLYPLNDKSAFYFSLAGRGAFYRSDYSDFNYFSADIFAAFKSYFSPTSIFKSNYSLEYKNYRDSLYDFLSHSVMLSFDKYLQSKTTLKGELGWGYKHFFHPYLIGEETSAQEHRVFMGKGRPGAGRQDQSYFQTLSGTRSEGIQVLSLAGLVAQGLGNRLGLRLAATKQWVLSGQNPFTFIEEFYAVENPSYDRFSWDGYNLETQLTLLIPWNVQLKLGYAISNKEFPGIESFDLDGSPLGITRRDTRNRIEVRTEKNFPAFSVFLSYLFINNSSNDRYFDWNGNFISLGIEWNVPLGSKK